MARKASKSKRMKSFYRNTDDKKRLKDVCEKYIFQIDSSEKRDAKIIALKRGMELSAYVREAVMISNNKYRNLLNNVPKPR